MQEKLQFGAEGNHNELAQAMRIALWSPLEFACARVCICVCVRALLIKFHACKCNCNIWFAAATSTHARLPSTLVSATANGV